MADFSEISVIVLAPCSMEESTFVLDANPVFTFLIVMRYALGLYTFLGISHHYMNSPSAFCFVLSSPMNRESISSSKSMSRCS